MERRKITKACFVGGFVCALLATLIMPKFWWLGLMAGAAAGFISGYLAYDFKKVIQAVPAAWQRAKRGTSETWNKIRAWLKKPHPLALMTVSGSLSFLVLLLLTVPRLEPDHPGFSVLVIIIGHVLSLVLCLLFAIFSAEVGSEDVEKCYILWPSLTNDEKRGKANQGLVGKPYTYRNFFRWVLKGAIRMGQVLLFLFAYFFYFFFWKIWRIGIGFLGRFVWNLFQLVHSKKRLLCGIWGSSGGLLSVLWLGSQAQSLTGYILVGLCGGLIGAAIGLLDYELISVRLLKLAPKNG